MGDCLLIFAYAPILPAIVALLAAALGWYRLRYLSPWSLLVAFGIAGILLSAGWVLQAAAVSVVTNGPLVSPAIFFAVLVTQWCLSTAAVAVGLLKMNRDLETLKDLWLEMTCGTGPSPKE